MSNSPDQTPIYHITDVENLPGILAEGCLRSDKVMAQQNPELIGYAHIKKRRLTEIRVDTCANRFVGEFVPFYFCPRSPMLYTVNLGKTGRPPGCQRTIVHLVSTVAVAIEQQRLWAISSGNAGAFHSTFSSDVAALTELNWKAIRASYWQNQTHDKSAEFLLADFFSCSGFHTIGCYDVESVEKVENNLKNYAFRPIVRVEPSWYY